MGGIIMVIGIVIILIITGIILSIILNVSNISNDDKGFRTATMLVTMLLSFLLGILVYGVTTPTIEDYVHGKVRVEINQVYENGEVVRCDTTYYKL